MSCWALFRTYSSSKRSHFLFLSAVIACNWSWSVVSVPIKRISYFLLFCIKQSGLLIHMLIVILFLHLLCLNFFIFTFILYNIVIASEIKTHSFFYWSIKDLQCCADLCCTAKWLSYIHIDDLYFYILFHYGLSQYIEYSSLCCTVGPCCLSIL